MSILKPHGRSLLPDFLVGVWYAHTECAHAVCAQVTCSSWLLQKDFLCCGSTGSVVGYLTRKRQVGCGKKYFIIFRNESLTYSLNNSFQLLLSHQFILFAVTKLKATTPGLTPSGNPKSSLVFVILFTSQKPACPSDLKMSSFERGKAKKL